MSYLTGEKTLFRRARFVPLRWADGPVICILAVVSDQDSDRPPAEVKPSESDEPQDLHLLLQQFRGQKRLLYRARSVVGASPAIRRAAAQAAIAASTRASVLIVGPPGSGRRHLAEAIHYSGPAPLATQPAGPLVPLECGLLDAELLRATLRRVPAAASEGGTLLLCDADRLPTEVQTALVSALSSPGFPWRVIATAAVPLVGIAPRGAFREDLAAALCTIVIVLPPLAERRGDVPLLAQALLEEQNARGGKQLGGFARRPGPVMRYPWPGNVAELAEVLAAAHARAASPLVSRADLPERLHAAAETAARPRRKDEPVQIDDFLARIERELIHRALARSASWQQGEGRARFLGLKPPRGSINADAPQLGLIEKEETE